MSGGASERGAGGGGAAAASGRNLPPLRLPNSSSDSHTLELQPILLNTPLALSDAGASGWANGGGIANGANHNSHHVSSRLNNGGGAPSTSTSTNDSSVLLVLPAPPGLQNPAAAHLWRTTARNLALILTWYFFSTCLSLWNRTLLGHGHGVAGRGAFPAPMLMTALQFCLQILMAKGALWLGVEGGGKRGSSRGSRGAERGRPLRPPPPAGRRRAAPLPARRWKRLSDSEQQPPELAGSSSPPRSTSPIEASSSSSPTNQGGAEGNGGGEDAGSGLSWKEYFTKVVPNGVCTGLDIGLSNFSLSLISLSFYTMCKSTTPLFLLAFAFAWGLEKPSWSLAGVVAVISSGLMLLVYGEAHFDGVGFALVMTASALSGLRWTITQVLLQGGGGAGSGGGNGGSDGGGGKGKGGANSSKLPLSSSSSPPPSPPRSPARSPSAAEAGNGGSGAGGGGHGAAGQGPVAVVAALMPVMALTVALVSLLAERLWVVLPHSPYFDSLASVGLTLALVAGGAAIAFAMVWVEFTVIKLTSALTFMVAGTFKEIVTVLAAVAFLGESFSRVNAAGLAVLVAGVALFNWTKYRKVASEQREAAAAVVEAEAAAARASASFQNPASLAASAYETFVPSSSYPAVNNISNGGGIEAAARKRRGGVGDGGGASLDSGAPPPLSLSSTSTPTTTADGERPGATPLASAVAAAGGPGGSPLRPRAAGSSLAPSGANSDRGERGGDGG